MKKVFLFLTLLFSCVVFSLHAEDKDKISRMSESARNKYLVKLAKEVTKNFGPEWYRDNLKAEIADSLTVFYDANDKRIEVSKNNGRSYYTVTLYYDEAMQKELNYEKASTVKIWADNGEPSSIIFGHNLGYNFYFISYRSQIKAGVTKENQIPFQKIEPPHIEPDGTLVITLY